MASRLAHKLLTSQSAASARPKPSTDAADNDISDCLLLVGEALKFFSLHFRQPLPLEALARGIGVSEHHLVICFARARGITPNEALLEFRLNRLFQTLREHPSQSLRRSIRECGLTHTDQLIQMFESSFGIAMAPFLLTCRRAQQDRAFRRLHPHRRQLVLPCP
ncbi:MAG: helix-turn-helix domain-containing protein [Cyanobium sp.]